MLSDVVGAEKAAEIKNEIEVVVSNLIIWKTVRPWSEFFAVFKPPQWNYGLVEQRVTTNCLHYRSNYIIVCVGIFAIRVVFSPMMLLSLMICTFTTLYLLKVVKMPLIVGRWTLKYRDKCIILLGLSLSFLTFTGILMRLIWTFLVMVLICGLHMIFRLQYLIFCNPIYDSFVYFFVSFPQCFFFLIYNLPIDQEV